MTLSDSGVPDVVARMLHAVDDLDWDVVRLSLAAKVITDYTSLWGGEPQAMDADELVASWRGLATGFDVTQHLIGPVVMIAADDQRTTCTTTFRAYHRVVDGADTATWMVAGRYVITLDRAADGWKISGVTLRLAYEEGDRALLDVARERVTAGSGGRV